MCAERHQGINRRCEHLRVRRAFVYELTVVVGLLLLTMDFINVSFTDVESLKSVDKTIGDLENENSKLSEAIKTRFSSGIPEEGEDNETVLFIGKITEGIQNAIETRNDEGAVLNIRELIDKYGSLELLENIHSLYERKLRLKNSLEYLSIAREVEKEVGENNSIDLPATIKSLQKLKSLIEMKHQCEFSDTVEKYLSDLLGKKVKNARSEFETSLRTYLHENGWFSHLRKQSPVSPELSSGIEARISQLVCLQNIRFSPHYPETWWALDILLEPAILSFKYHFASPNKQTNRLSKPEWPLHFVENFFADSIGYLAFFTREPFREVSRIAEIEIISGFLKILREKIFVMVDEINEIIQKYRNDASNLEKGGRLLSHLVYELAAFDYKLRDIYKYNPHAIDSSTMPSEKWIGLTGDLFLRQDNNNLAAKNWLDYEMKLGFQRFNEIMDSDRAFELEYSYRLTREREEETQMVSKPTQSAFNLVQLFNNLTSHHRTLSIVRFQLKYVSDIQLKLIESYLNKLEALLKQYRDSFSPNIVRSFIPRNVSEKASVDLNGKKSLLAIEKLSELHCLVHFLYENLQQWGQELIFIQLWNAYQQYKQDEPDESSLGLTIFTDAMNHYESFMAKVKNEYKNFFRHEIRESLKQYVNCTRFDVLTFSNPEPSNNLSLIVSSIPIYMTFLGKCLSKLDYYALSSMALTMFSSIFYEFVISNNLFSKFGVQQLNLDFEYLNNNFKSYLLLYHDLLDYSNIDNYAYAKVLQSIDFLASMDVQTAKSFQNQYSKISSIRSRFKSNLDKLQDHEINDLCFRVL